jgi:hypothetical protein
MFGEFMPFLDQVDAALGGPGTGTLGARTNMLVRWLLVAYTVASVNVHTLYTPSSHCAERHFSTTRSLGTSSVNSPSRKPFQTPVPRTLGAA